MDATTPAGSGVGPPRVRLFESYGRKDASDLAERLREDLESRGYEVWQDVRQIHAGRDWAHVVEKGIRESDTVVAILSPHATRQTAGTDNADDADSTCLDEIAFARFGRPPRPIVPVMGVPCQPPLPIYRLDYIDLTGWRESEELYERGLERLCEGITSALQGRTTYREVVSALDPLDFGHFLNTKREHFCGRDWLFAEIHEWRAGGEGRALLITGDPGAGKSALVAELVYRNPDGQVVAYHCCQADVPLHLAPGPFVRSIAAMLATQIPAYADAIERGRPRDVLAAADSDPDSAFELGVIEPLAALPPPPGPARYILIDSLDEAMVRGKEGGRTIVDLLSTRVERLPRWLRVIATTRREDAVLERFRGVRALDMGSHDPRNEQDIAAYIEARLSSHDLSAMLTEQGADGRDVASWLCSLSAGSFVYAKQALAALASGTLRCDGLARQPPGLATLYLEFFTRTFVDERAYAPVRDVLCVLVAAHGGLTEEQLAAATGTSPPVLRALLAPLSAYLSVVEGRVRLFHASLAEWLTETQVGSARFLVDRTRGQALLLSYCQRWSELDDDYPLRELPRHLAQAGDTDALRSVLLDPAFEERRRLAGIPTAADVEDFRMLVTSLLRSGQGGEVAALAVTANAYRRDGVAAALRDAPARSDPEVRRVVQLLLRAGGGNPEALNSRLAAVSVAAARGYREELNVAAQDASPAVRAALVPHLYRYWRAHPVDERWQLLDSLGRRFTNRVGLPREEMVEVVGGLALAITAREFDDDETMARLGVYCRDLVARTLRSPVARAAGRRTVLKVAVAALAKVMRDQPDYQPINLRELKHSLPSSADARARTLAVVGALEEPQLGFAPLVDALVGDNLAFDVVLMVAAERALAFHGWRDPAGVITALEQVYTSGAPWFGQSCLYVASKVLETVPLATTDATWLDRYAAMTMDFVTRTRATLTTEVATYDASPPLAGIEVVFERHQPSGRARFLPHYLTLAADLGDDALARRVVKGAHLLSLVGHPHAALDALRDVAAAGRPELEGPVVEALANIRLYEDEAVDRFLRTLGRPELGGLVRAASPTLSANEFPTMIDFFVNRQLMTSEAARREVAGAFRRAAGAASAADLLHDVVVWVMGLLARYGPEP